jgi:hypothetical protein
MGEEREVFVNHCFPPAVRRSSQILAIGCLLALTSPATALGHVLTASGGRWFHIVRDTYERRSADGAASTM